MIAAARLDPRIYEEVEADSSGTAQAMTVVILSSLAGGIGSVGFGGPSLAVAAAGAVGALLGWVVLAALTYVVGTQLLAEPTTRADVAQLMRTLGFAQAPGIMRVLGAVPVVGTLALGVVSLWMLVAMVIAVRQALDYASTPRAIVVCLAGWILSLVAYGLAIEAANRWLETLPQQVRLLPAF